MSIRFFKRLRQAEGLFATDLCRVPKALDPVQDSECGRMIKRALDLQARVVDGTIWKELGHA